MPTVALMGGSFNPVHTGHMMVAQYVAQWCDGIDRVMMVLSPMNPLKTDMKAPASDKARMDMLEIAAGSSDGLIDVSDIELSMPRPSYTIDTLNLLSSKYPDTEFRLIIGSDNWNNFDKWKNADEIIDRFGLIVYPRPGYPPVSIPDNLKDKVMIIDAPVADISSTWIRNAIACGRRVNFFLPPGVYEYIEAESLYR
ncbi:MAG: nicotinate (nicotinamide) nucleotide adenylyltransferase [Muribaculaceae bacterium]|nr:nicotinate (nicotinamide) nucleotide adenylyltransferase [Muribaculaceae bacterium]